MSNSPLDEIKFWQQVIGDAHRIIVCHPKLAPRVRELVEQYQIGGIVSVQESPYAPEDKIYVIADRLIEAAQAEALQLRKDYRFWLYEWGDHQ
jgi:hypothetical protein